jgi:hypothetical protein
MSEGREEKWKRSWEGFLRVKEVRFQRQVFQLHANPTPAFYFIFSNLSFSESFPASTLEKPSGN